MTSDERSIFVAASTIRAQVRNMDCKMPWPPQATDLKTENIELVEYFSMFLIPCCLAKFQYNLPNVQIDSGFLLAKIFFMLYRMEHFVPRKVFFSHI